MKKIDTIVVAPHFYTMEGAGVGYHSDAAMAVDGGKILKVGNRPEILAEYTAEEMITLDHHMVLPGFIDGHMHTACNIMRGLAQDTNSWMMFGLQPFDNAVNDEERDVGSRVAILEAVRAGTTTLGDYDSKMENVCAFIDKVGARGNIAQTIQALLSHGIIKLIEFARLINPSFSRSNRLCNIPSGAHLIDESTHIFHFG